VSSLWGSESLHGSLIDVRHGGGNREAQSGMAVSTRRGGTGQRQQLMEAWHQASSAEEWGVGHGFELRARTRGAPVTATVALW
jgi:hypothetical protein